MLYIFYFHFKELNQRREEKRNEVKRKAEEEVKYLQASGKVTKTPSNMTFTGRKKTISKNTIGSGKKDSKAESQSRSSVFEKEEEGAVGGASPRNQLLHVCIIDHAFLLCLLCSDFIDFHSVLSKMGLVLRLLRVSPIR